MGKLWTVVAAFALAVFASAAAADGTGFVAPSKNITCYLDRYDWDTDKRLPASQSPLLCLVWEAQWSPPLDFGDDDPTCDLDQTRVVILQPSGKAKARWICHGDVFWPLPLPTLGYGSDWSVAGYACSMAKDGVRCSNRSGGRFHIRRSALKLN